jgi:acyl-CoA thioester hydrolase
VTGETRVPPAVRSEFVHWSAVATRWNDNDVYGHVNNVVYYGYFDTIVNAYAISRGGLDIHAGEAIGIVVESGCRYYAPLEFPQVIDAGLRVDRIGRSSIRYSIGLFAGGAATAAAEGHFVHVMVDRQSRRPVDIPSQLRQALAEITISR